MMKKRQHPASGCEKITVLAVGPDGADKQSLRELLASEACEFRTAASCDEALQQISEDPPTIVACEQELPDGTWRDLFSLINKLHDRPPLIVMSRQADERLWAEVLNIGGYDVLAKPLERKEVSRVMEMASRYGRFLHTATA